MDITEHLNDIYFDPGNPGSFGGPDRLKREAKVSLKEATAYLQGVSAYNKNKSIKHKFVRRKIACPIIDYQWQTDLLSLQRFSRQNKGYNYILTVIDVASRFAFAIPLKTKSANAVTEGFRSILEKSKRKPKFLEADEGKEYFNKTFLEMCEEFGIKLYHNESPLKASMIERFNRTLMTRLTKIFTYRNKTSYYDILQNVIDSYNSCTHRIIKHAPKHVNKYNQMDCWFNTYQSHLNLQKRKSNLKVGDFVRIKMVKQTFTKGYEKSFSEQVFQIVEVVNSLPVTYKIADSTGLNIKGIFYPEELSTVKL